MSSKLSRSGARRLTSPRPGLKVALSKHAGARAVRDFVVGALSRPRSGLVLVLMSPLLPESARFLRRMGRVEDAQACWPDSVSRTNLLRTPATVVLPSHPRRTSRRRPPFYPPASVSSAAVDSSPFCFPAPRRTTWCACAICVNSNPHPHQRSRGGQDPACARDTENLTFISRPAPGASLATVPASRFSAPAATD